MFSLFKKKTGKIKIEDDLIQAKNLGLITEREQLRLQFDRIEKKLKDYDLSQEKKEKIKRVIFKKK